MSAGMLLQLTHASTDNIDVCPTICVFARQAKCSSKLSLQEVCRVLNLLLQSASLLGVAASRTQICQYSIIDRLTIYGLTSRVARYTSPMEPTRPPDPHDLQFNALEII
jgi:hypothetical protein